MPGVRQPDALRRSWVVLAFVTLLLATALAASSTSCARRPTTPGPGSVTPTQTGSLPSTPPQEPSVTPTPPTSSTPEPSTSPTPAPPKPTPPAPIGSAPSDNKTRSWYYVANSSHKPPAVAPGAKTLLAKYHGRYLGPDRNRVYLTFDEGYENGNTAKILDALARNKVKATFFVTESYIRANPALVRRMVKEGHAVGNHSATHPSMPSLAHNRSAFKAELTRTEKAFTEVTGSTLKKIFRPPKGEYSPLSLWLTASFGYESVFWSFAHRDWIVDDQPPVAATISRILTGSHPGAIFLLHGVSSSDTQALDDAIAGLRKQGYGFGLLGS